MPAMLTIDFETYYSSDFSLTKLTTEEYIRDPQFEVIGVAVDDGNDTEWFSGSREETRQFLLGYPFAESLVLAHNAMFDAAILVWHFGITPKGWLDTLSMARALHGTEVSGSLASLAKFYSLGEKGTEVQSALGKRRCDFTPGALRLYGAYCVNDVELTRSLFAAMMWDGRGFPKSELALIDATIRMFAEPVLELDVTMLSEHLRALSEKKQAVLDSVDGYGYSSTALSSNQQLADALRKLGVEPPVKISPTTQRETYAFAKTDEAFRALLEHESFEVQALVAARLHVKSTLEQTRTERFVQMAQRGPMPIPLRYYAAHTGRWGGADKLNLQNLPRKSTLKRAILAPDGYVICDSDSSQIEARTLAWVAGQDDLVEAFAQGQDVYKIMASAIYDKPADDISADERFVGKVTILGCGYGMGADRFRVQLKTMSGKDFSVDECQRIIDTYRSTYPKIVQFWNACSQALDVMVRGQRRYLGRNDLLHVEGASILLPNGLSLRFPNLRLVQGSKGYEYSYDSKMGRTVTPTKLYGGKLTENICQALARIIIGEQLIRIARRYKVVLTVHDAIACLIENNQDAIATGVAFVEGVMRTTPEWAEGLPLNCEAGYGLRYGDC